MDLAARPEYLDMIRSEIMAVKKSDGRRLKADGLTKLLKLDSFIKESLRVNSAAIRK